jgi:xanthine/uracil permease
LYKEILIDYTINKFILNRILGITGAVLTLVIPFFLWLQNRKNPLDAKQSFCPLKATTGFPCPSCGITKSIVYFYDGNLLKSLSFHLFGPLVVGFCIFIIVLFLVEIKTKNVYFRKWFYSRKLAYFLAVFLIVYHIIRLFLFLKENSWVDIVEQSIWG